MRKSPCCSSYALQRIADDHIDTLGSETLKAIKGDFYVDDLLKSVRTVQEGKSLCYELTDVLQERGFRLTKFISNSKELLQSLPESSLAHSLSCLKFDEAQFERTLGIKWDISNDKFVFSTVSVDQAFTKRGLLKTVSSIFDPLGFLSPFTMRAKCILQELRRNGLIGMTQ